MTYPDFEALCARTDVPPGSSWGVFNEDPERGTANFATANEVVKAAGCIRTGEVFSLDLALDAFNPPVSPTRAAPQHEITSHRQSRDDVLREFHLQASSQLDGLRHRRVSGWGFYNGVPDHQIVAGDPSIGVQRWSEKPIAGRGILVDLAGQAVRGGRRINHEVGEVLDIVMLQAALDAQNVKLCDGDILLVHTGWVEWYLGLDTADRTHVRNAGRFTGFGQSGEFPKWVWDNRLAMLASDTVAVEALPPSPSSPFLATAAEDGGMMHQALIGKLGVPLGELWNLGPLARHSETTGRWDAFVTVKPLHLVGGVGSPPNATAVR